jgi:acetylornithine deacetylase
MYGRGTADMKSGLMASVMAVQLLKDAGYQLPGDVIITSVCDEEGGGNGSMQAVMRGIRADGVINCEGSSDELILAHMGWVFFRVDFVGRSCHSGGKRNGVSAIDKAIKVIQALNEKEHEWLLTYKHPLLPAPNLNIGVIEGGTAGSTVPGECSFSTCVHFIPNQMSHDQVVAEFTDVVNRVARSDPWMEQHPPKITMYQAGNGFEMDPEHEFIKTFRSAYQNALNREVRIVGSPSGCDARLWSNIAGCPTLEFGPGNLSECHSVDEWVSIDSYLESILIYAQTILEWCGNAE